MGSFTGRPGMTVGSKSSHSFYSPPSRSLTAGRKTGAKSLCFLSYSPSQLRRCSILDGTHSPHPTRFFIVPLILYFFLHGQRCRNLFPAFCRLFSVLVCVRFSDGSAAIFRLTQGRGPAMNSIQVKGETRHKVRSGARMCVALSPHLSLFDTLVSFLSSFSPQFSDDCFAYYYLQFSFSPLAALLCSSLSPNPLKGFPYLSSLPILFCVSF